MRSRGDRYRRRVRVDGRWYHPWAPHGTGDGYANWGCRCAPCTGARTDEVRADRARRVAWFLRLDAATGAPTTTAPGVAHGRASTYQNWGCRCDACRVEASRVRARYPARRAGRS